MTILPCYCKPGPLSQCVAEDYNQQQSCIAFEKSNVANRCMNRNENMNNHCWSATAQSIGLVYSDAPIFNEPPVEELVDISVTPSCFNCARYRCTYLDTKMRAAAPNRLTMDDLCAEAQSCQGYELEEGV